MKFAYRFMRPIARFPLVRNIAIKFSKLRKPVKPYISPKDPIKLQGVTESDFINNLKQTGFASGLRIQEKQLKEIQSFAQNNLTFANSNSM